MAQTSLRGRRQKERKSVRAGEDASTEREGERTTRASNDNATAAAAAEDVADERSARATDAIVMPTGNVTDGERANLKLVGASSIDDLHTAAAAGRAPESGDPRGARKTKSARELFSKEFSLSFQFEARAMKGPEEDEDVDAGRTPIARAFRTRAEINSSRSAHPVLFSRALERGRAASPLIPSIPETFTLFFKS